MQFSSPTEYFQKINQVFNWILAGPLAYFAYLFLSSGTDGWDALVTHEFYQRLCLYTFLPVALLLSIYAYRQYRENNRETDKSQSLKDKLKDYYDNFFRFQILLTIASGVSLVGLHISGKGIFLGAYIAILFMTSIHRPTPHTISKAIRLNKDEKSILMKKEAFPD